MMEIPSRDAADTLMAKLQSLLDDQITCSWDEVLATAIALKHATACMSDAAEIRRALDVEVISKAYIETGRPGQAVAVLVDTLAAISELPCDADTQRQLQASYELHVRHLLQRCYQTCLTAAPEVDPPCCSLGCCCLACCESAAACCQQHCSCSLKQQQQVQQHNCSTPTAQQQQQYMTSSIANSQRMQQIASLLNDHHQSALIAADMADQYVAAGDVSSACKCYGSCLDACTAAAAAAGNTAGAGAGDCSWVPELLTSVVPAALDAHLQQADAAGGQCCLAAYSAVLQALGRSACEECAVCCEQLTGSTAVTLLACGHLFHRACCNEWFGHKLFEAGSFQPECPLCRQVDLAIQPSAAALDALADMQQYHSAHSAHSEPEETSAEEESASEEEGEEEGEDGSSLVDADSPPPHADLIDRSVDEHDSPAAQLQVAGQQLEPLASLHDVLDIDASSSSSYSAQQVALDISHGPHAGEEVMDMQQLEFENDMEGTGTEPGRLIQSGQMIVGMDMESELEGSVASSTCIAADVTAAAALAVAFATPTARC